MSVALDLQTNPLIAPSTLPNDALPLNKVKTAHFLPALQHGIELVRAEVEAIKSNPEAPSFSNTIEALEFSGQVMDRASSVFELFSNSKSTGVFRKLEKTVAPMLSNVSNEIYQDSDLFARVDAVYKSVADGAVSLNPEQKMLLQKTHDSFTKKGVNLSPENKKRFQEIEERLSVLTSQFGENVLNGTQAFKLFISDKTRLDGVPERAMKEYKGNAEKAGKPDQWLIVLQPYPSDIMTHCKDRSLRKEIQQAYFNVGYADPKQDNRPVILEILKLKHEKAVMMGFQTTAAQILSKNMAKNPETVRAFLEKNLAVYKPAAEEYLKKVRAYAADPERGDERIDDIQSWDVGYYGRALKEKTFSIDVESLRPYFELQSTFNGMVRHAEDAFGLELRPAGKKYPVHHRDVSVYEVFNKSSDSFVGLFYANYYARPGAKGGGAWMDELQGRFVQNGVAHTPAITNDCNYKKLPDGQPELLTISDVETMFHEFGHGLHGLVTKAEYPSLAGTRVKRDWVELPSQLQEGWVMAKAKDQNDSFASHHETGKKIPAELLEKVEAMNNFDAGYVGLRQTFFGLLDMASHDTDPSTIKSVEELEDSVGARAVLLPRVGGCQATQFGHLFAGGYAAGYYGYKWADVMAADVDEKSQEKGVLYDKEFLATVEQQIYATGGTCDHKESYRAVMGRDPDPDALFRREGLIPKP